MKLADVWTRRTSIVCVGFLIVSLTGCQSGGYLSNRGGDFVEIFTLGAEKRVVGASAQLLGIPIGLAWNSEGYGYGLRAGTKGDYATGHGEVSLGQAAGNSILVLSSNAHEGSDRSKDFTSRGILIMGYQASGYNALTQFEVSLGLYYGLRVGFNLAELADFFIGWSTVDILDDDATPAKPPGDAQSVEGD